MSSNASLQIKEELIQKQLVYIEPPAGYNPRCHVAACFCQYNDEFLFLLRQPDKSCGNTWGIPGGKLDAGDTVLRAVIRELVEETSLQLSDDEVEELQTVYIRYPTGDFTYTMFRKVYHERPANIRLNPAEHQEARWLTLQDALELPLIPGEDECIYLAYGIKKSLS